MSQFVLDTHATVREFEAAGMETRQAEAVVSAMANTRGTLATKDDLDVLKSGMDSLRVDLDSLRVDLDSLRTDFDTLRTDFNRFATKEDLKQFATKADLQLLRKDMETLRKDIERQISGAVNKMLIYMFGFATLIIGVLKYL